MTNPSTNIVFADQWGGSADFISRAFNHPIIESFDAAYATQIKVSIVINMTGTFKEVIEFIVRDIPSPNIKFSEAGSFIVQNHNVIKSLLIHGSVDVKDPFKIFNRSCKIYLNGSYDAVEQTYNRLNDYNINNKKTLLYWCFKSNDNIEFVKFPLTTNSPIRSEFYPWLGKENVNDYIDRFENSNSNILILLGEPGTGKTSFIRYLITRANQHCFTTYDEEVMQQDQLYVKFLSEDVRYLILEDADLLLTDRINTGNRVMSKMLNAADGLVSFNDKKMIFTANIRDKAKIDEALVRKGRCFDVVEFEAMSPEQTVNAAKAAGLDFKFNPNQIPRRYSLAEMFSSAA